MNIADIPGVGSLPVLLAYHINLLSDRHEAAWRAGRRPRIEDVLTLEDEPGRTILLRELLAAELAARRLRGEMPDRREYRVRFPDDTALIEAVIAEAELTCDRLATAGLKQPVPAEAGPRDGADRDPLVDRETPALPRADRAHEAGESVPIRAHDDSTQPGGSPAGTDSSAAPIREAVGPDGRFHILRRHARGGLGEVFVAFDEELHREVALKEIRPEHAGQARSQARFLREAEITGGLEHPGIVPVYGLGRYADGRPYYAMRFVQGHTFKEAIAAFHDAEVPHRDAGERTLALRQLLRRFLDVCNALAYAHSRGVLHRDLKPANILLGPFGETLIVDWGLAKPMDSPDEAGSQSVAALRPSLAGDSTLTQTGSALGTPSFMSPEQAAGRLDRVGPPSDVYSLGATLYCVLTGRAPIEERDIDQALRKAEAGDFPPPRQVQGTVDAGLEAICLRAMAREPEDRYPSPLALAEDLEHWLADEPVTARRDSLFTAAWRWVRKHRTLTTSAAAVALVTLASLGIVYRREAKYASVLATSNTNLDRKNTELSASAERERQRFDLAREAIQSFTEGVREDETLKNRNLEALRAKLLRRSQEFHRKLEGLLKGQTDRRSQEALALSFYDLGNVTSEIGNRTEALTAHEQALSIRQKLVEANPAVQEFQSDLAHSYHSIGNLLGETGKPTDAMASHEKARSIQQKLAAANPTVTRYQSDLATEDIEIGRLLARMGKPYEAMESYHQARSILQKLADANPGVTEFQQLLSNCHNNIGIVLGATGKPADAMASYEKARSIRQKLADANPAVTGFQQLLATAHYNVGLLLWERGKSTEALAAHEKARSIRQELAHANPAVTEFQCELADSQNSIGYILAETRKPLPALASFEQARSILQKLADANPAVTEFQQLLAHCHNNIGRLLRETGQPNESLAAYEKARSIRQKLGAANPAVTQFQVSLAYSYTNIGNLLRTMDKPTEALAAHESARSIFQKLADANPAVTGFQSELGGVINNMAMVDMNEGRWRKAYERLSQAIRLQRVALRLDSRHPGYRSYLRNHLHNLTPTCLALRKPAEAAAAAHEFETLSAGQPDDLYDSARWLSRCVPLTVDAAEAGRYADEATAALSAAVSAGYSDGSRMTRDADLGPLHGRDDFQRLVLGLMDRAFPAQPFAQ